MRRAFALLLAATAPTPAFAQDASTAPGPGTMATTAEPETADRSLLSDEIVVTAQKRAQNVQDVGIAVAAFTGDQLRELGVTDSTNLSTLVPGVHVSGNIAGQNQQVTIRGVVQNDYNDIVEAPNAVYLDEGYIAVAQAQTFALVDIERVEVLKGPQGTLFGRNATGGLVHFISRKPSLTEISGFLDLSGGVHDSPENPGQFRVEGAVGGPLTDTLAARVAVVWNYRDPYLINEYPLGAVGGSPGPGAGADMGDDDTLAGRASVLWEPTGQLRALASFNGARSRINTGPYQQKPTIAVFDATGELIDVQNVSPTETRASIGANGQDLGTDLDNDNRFGDTFGRPVPGGDIFGYIDRDGDDFTTSSDFAFEDSNFIDTWGVNLNLQYEVNDDITITLITDYKKYDKLLFIDVDAGPGNQSANYAAVDGYSVTQELRVNGSTGPLTYTAGLYYLHIDSESDNGLKFPVGSVVPGAPFDLGSDARLKTDSYSAFGQIEWEFVDRLTLVVGGRVIREEKDYVFAQNIYGTADSREIHVGPGLLIGPVPTPTGAAAFTDKRGDTLWSGKAQLEFRPNDDLLLYAGANRGVKAASYNAQLAGGRPLPPSFIPYDEEVLLSYEGGFKWTIPSINARLNASAFFYDYSDYQSFLFTGVSGVVINADAETYGVEAEAFISPVPGLDLGFTVSALDAKVKDVPLRVGGPIVRDVEPVYTPELQTSFIGRYQFDFARGKLALQGDAQTGSSYYYNLRNFSADKFDKYFVLNAGVSFLTPNERFRFAVDVKNITDERVGIQGFDLAGLCGCNEVSYKPPRLFLFSARMTL